MSKRGLMTISLLLTLALLVFFAYTAITAKTSLDNLNNDNSTSANESQDADDALKEGLGNAFAGLGLAIVLVICVIIAIYLAVTLIIKLIARGTGSNVGSFFAFLFDGAASGLVGYAVYSDISSITANPSKYIALFVIGGAVVLATLLDFFSFFAD